MTVAGYLDVNAPGSLDLQVGQYTPTTMVVDGRAAEQSGESSYRIDVLPGLHLVQIDSTLYSNRWQFNAAFNHHPLGSRGFPLTTIERPGTRDRGLLRAIVGWSTTILTTVLVAAWLIAALRAWGCGNRDCRWGIWRFGCSTAAYMVLSMNDPPRLVWYATPMLAAAPIAIAALAGVPVVRNLPLSLVLFFLAGISAALVARGVAYSGRFSTIMIGSAGAITIGAIALYTLSVRDKMRR